MKMTYEIGNPPPLTEEQKNVWLLLESCLTVK